MRTRGSEPREPRLKRQTPGMWSPHAGRSCVGMLVRYFFSETFWTRQLIISPTSSSFSLRQSIELAMPNCFS